MDEGSDLATVVADLLAETAGNAPYITEQLELAATGIGDCEASRTA